LGKPLWTLLEVLGCISMPLQRLWSSYSLNP
jgi:hypothetical protein